MLSHEDFIFRLQGPREWLTRCWCNKAKATADSLLEANPKNLVSQPSLPSSGPCGPSSQGPMSRKPSQGVEGPCCSDLLLLVAVNLLM